MYSKGLPEKGSIKYWSFVGLKGDIYLLKCEVLYNWYDKESESNVTKLKILEDISGSYREGATIHVDYSWQLQDDMETAKRIMFMGIFTDGFFTDKAPWE